MNDSGWWMVDWGRSTEETYSSYIVDQGHLHGPWDVKDSRSLFFRISLTFNSLPSRQLFDRLCANCSFASGFASKIPLLPTIFLLSVRVKYVVVNLHHSLPWSRFSLRVSCPFTLFFFVRCSPMRCFVFGNLSLLGLWGLEIQRITWV